MNPLLRSLAEPVASSKPDLRRLLALTWSALEAATRQLINIGLSFALLAFITPHDLGVFALSYALNQIPNMLLDEPVFEALIQRPVVTERDWNTGYTINLLLSIGATVLSFGVSRMLAHLLLEPALVWSLPTVTLCSLAGSFGSLQKGHLARELRFRSVATSNLTAGIAASICGLVLAVLGTGYWALIASLGTYNVLTSLFWWRLCPWVPRLAFDTGCARWLREYGLQSVAVRIVLLVRDNAPPIVVGSLYGTVVIGYFSLSFRIARSVGLFFEDATKIPLMAVMSREQHDPKGAGELMLNIFILLGAVALPGFVGLMLIGQDAPRVIFGSIWAPSGAMVPWLCAVVAGWLLLHIPSVALRASGRVSHAFWLTAPPIALDVSLLVVLAPCGLMAALIGMAIRAALSLPLLAIVLRVWLFVPVERLLRLLLLPIAGLMVMVTVVLMSEQFDGGWRGLALACVAGAMSYAAIVGGGSFILNDGLLRAIRGIG